MRARATGWAPGWAWPLALGAAALALYASALGHPWVGDDELAVAQNPTVARPSAAGLRGLWTADYWQGIEPDGRAVVLADDRNLYRPVTVLSFWLSGALGGLDPWRFRLANVLLHAAAAWLVGLVARSWGGPTAGVVAAGVVLLHPAATDVVCRIVGRADILALAGLAGFLAVQRAAGGAGWSWPRTFGAAAAAALAFGAKESGLALVPLALAQAWLGRRAGSAGPAGGGAPGGATTAGRAGGARAAAPPAPARSWRGGAALAVPLALVAAGRLAAVGLPSYAPPPVWDLGGNPLWGKDLAGRLPASAALAWSYARAMVWPWPLIAFDVPGRLPAWSDPEVWMGAGVAAALAVAAVGLLAAGRPLGLAAAWWLASYLVVSQLLTPIGAYREVRFAYPMVGALALAAGLVAARAREWRPPARAAAAAVAGAAALAAVVAVVARTPDFRSLEALLEADLRRRPASPAALIRLANVRERAGRLAEAEGLYARVTALAPGSAQAWYERADFEGRRGRRDLARDFHERAVAANPEHHLALMELGTMAMAAGDLARAQALLERAEAAAPDDPFVAFNLAVLDDHRGDAGAAIARLERLLARRPDFALAADGLAKLRAARARSSGE